MKSPECPPNSDSLEERILATRLRVVSCSEVLTSFESGNDERGTFDGSPFGNGSVDQLVMADASVELFVFPASTCTSRLFRIRCFDNTVLMRA